MRALQSALATRPLGRRAPGEQGAHTVPFRRAAKPLTVRRRMHASLLTHPWPFPLLQDARMQNKQGPIFTWERQTRCVASMRGTGIRLGPSTTHPFLPRSPHAMQKGHALAPHTGLPRSAWCNFSGSRCSTHQIYRPQSQTGNKRGGASDSVWNILKDILSVRPMTERNCALTFKFCPESCVCTHARAHTHHHHQVTAP